jgi:murein DD-endopeptidase MepM/ murein hydrolase activator NlpD
MTLRESFDPGARMPAAFPVRTTRRIALLVRFCCIAGFFAGSLLPLYVPSTALGGEAEEYLSEEQFLLVEEGFVMKTASISEQGHRLAYTQGIEHSVGDAESLSSIADLYGISLDTIRWANNLKEGQMIHPGDRLLVLPVDGVLHTVKRGQNLLKIAELYDVDVARIREQNQVEDDRIFAGQQLIIPGGTPIVSVARSPSVPGGRPEAAPPRVTPPPEAEPPASFGVFQKPCDCAYTQHYHAGHYAVDLSENGGGPIFAAEDGIVIRAEYGWNGGYGNVIEIDHGNDLVTLYAHNKALHIREGAAVRRGDVIASMGNTGRVYGRTGVHVHFEVIHKGVKKNPLLYLQ